MKSKTIKIGSLVACLLMIAMVFAFVNPAQAAITKTVQVSSKQPWTDTGLTVSPGDVISITASGICKFGDPAVDNSAGPDGIAGSSSNDAMLVTDPTIPTHSLVGNIAGSSSLDGKGFFVGSRFQGTVPIPNTTTETGKLFLSFNDNCIYPDRSGYNSYCWTGDNAGSFTAIITINQIIPATINFDPDTLNLQSKGKWVTTYIELPEGYYVSNIDVSTVMLNDQVQAETKPIEIGDYDDDGIADIMVKFDRAAVQEILEVGEEVEITVTGEVGGTQFEGSDTIRVIDKGKGK